MFQLYLLTVLTNILAGLALAGSFLTERFERFADYTDFMSNTIYRVILGVVTLLVGLINLFNTYPGDIPVLGDLFPSLSGIVAGTLLIVAFVNKRRVDNANKASDLAEKLEKISAPYLAVVGIASVIIGVLNALVPKLPLL